MKKRKMMSIVMLSLLAVGLVSAGIVTYLSNKATASFGVDTPMVVLIDGVEGVAQLDIYAGEVVDMEVTVENRADVETVGTTSIKMSNGEGIDCSEFDYIMVGMTTPWVIAPVDILLNPGACVQDGPNTISLMFGPVVDTYAAGRLDTISVSAKFNQYASGIYNLEIQIV